MKFSDQRSYQRSRMPLQHGRGMPVKLSVIDRSNSFLRRSIKFGYYPADGPMFEELCGVAR